MGTVAETTEGGSTSRILVQALEWDRNQTYPYRVIASNGVPGTPTSRASHEETAYLGKNSLPFREWVENMFHQSIPTMA